MKHFFLLTATLFAATTFALPVSAQTHTHRADEHRADEHRADEHRADEHRGDEKPRATQKKLSRGDVLWQQADAAFHKGDYESAIARYRELIEIEPHDAEAYSNAAWLIWSLGRGEEAATLVRQSTRRSPRSWAIWYNAGQHFFLQKREPQATHVFFERALALHPRAHNRWLTLHALAFAAEKAGYSPRAIQVWQRTLLENPNDDIAKRKLSQLIAKEFDESAKNAAQSVAKAASESSTR